MNARTVHLNHDEERRDIYRVAGREFYRPANADYPMLVLKQQRGVRRIKPRSWDDAGSPTEEVVTAYTVGIDDTLGTEERRTVEAAFLTATLRRFACLTAREWEALPLERQQALYTKLRDHLVRHNARAWAKWSLSYPFPETFPQEAV